MLEKIQLSVPEITQNLKTTNPLIQPPIQVIKGKN